MLILEDVLQITAYGEESWIAENGGPFWGVIQVHDSGRYFGASFELEVFNSAVAFGRTRHNSSVVA